MKKNFLHWAMLLTAGLGLALASCSDNKEEEGPAGTPIFPKAVEAEILSGESYTLPFETNMKWKASIPASTVFYIEDGEHKVQTLSGEAGKGEVVIGTYEIENFDEEHSCEVTLTIGGESRVVATLTITQQERYLTLRTSQVEDGDFVYSTEEEGLSYAYNEEPAETIDLQWPEARSGYMHPIVVEANFAWRLAEKSEWIADEDYRGEAGQKVEILLKGDPTKYPLDGDQAGKFVLCARSNPELKYAYTVTIPACRDYYNVSGFVAETRFNAKGKFFSAGSSSAGAWVDGGAHGYIMSAEAPVIFKFAKVTEMGGNSYLEASESMTKWLKIETAVSDAANVLKDYRYNITVEENAGDARDAVIIALPASVAKGLEAWELAEMDIKEEYQQYILTRVNQAAKPDLVSAVNPEGMAEVGAALEPLNVDEQGWVLETLNVAKGFQLTYTKQWSNEDSTLELAQEYTAYKAYDYDLNLMAESDSWLTVRKVNNGIVIDMAPSKDKCGNSSQMSEGLAHVGYVVFEDAEGAFVVIRCIYDETVNLGGNEGAIKVEFQYPQFAPANDESSLELLTSGELFEKYNPGNGAPVYHLTFRKPYATLSALKGLPEKGISNADEWLSYEPGDGTTIISMDYTKLPDGEKTMTSSIVFYDSSWSTAVVLVCTLDLTSYSEDDE
ncbi:MAG: hypothetical protein K2L04_07425 [Alistipes sp.]|nr:hypothetical protein [Alistipes sp.]